MNVATYSNLPPPVLYFVALIYTEPIDIWNIKNDVLAYTRSKIENSHKKCNCNYILQYTPYYMP